MFRGRILQVVDSLDYGDAVSNHVLALSRMLESAGHPTEIYTEWHDPKVTQYRRDLAELKVTESDIVILHYAGFSDHALPLVQDLRCTRIFLYHNITPHHYFVEGSALHGFCLKGRAQLKEIVRDFHYFWGVSQFNVDELVAQGAELERCAVVPIIVDPPAHQPEKSRREPGTWMFLGRVSPNKAHHRLVQMFARIRQHHPELAQRLLLVGNAVQDEVYSKLVRAEIERHGLQDHVLITGKVSDKEVRRYLEEASVYVSMSEHEGFGVPLVEATHHEVPVAALRSSALGETLGEGLGLADTEDQLAALIERTLSDATFRAALLDEQSRNAVRFTSAAVCRDLSIALGRVVPDPYRFQRVSVVICTYNRATLLARCLEYLQYQTCQNFEVIVVDGPSTDNTAQVIERYRDRIKFAQNPTRNLSTSRNMGIGLADGDLIAFIDDDAIPFDDWVATLLTEFSRRPLTHAAVGGPAYFSGTLRFQAQDIAINQYAETSEEVATLARIGTDGWERSMLGTNTCFRADLLRQHGGFDEEFDYFLDESEVSYRLQKRKLIVGYAAGLHLRHEFAQSQNRVSQYEFNWFSICKNIAYFVSVYSGLTDEALRRHVHDRIQRERLAPLERAHAAGAIAQDAFESYVRQIHAGVAQGLDDATKPARTRNFGAPPGRFLPFCVAQASYPLAGVRTPPLHVCIVTKEFPPFVPGGGIGTLYYHLASELLLMGHWVTVISPGEVPATTQQGRFQLLQVPVEELAHGLHATPGFATNVNWALTALSAVSQLHETQPIDVIDSALWDAEALAIALLPHTERPPLVLRLVTPFPVAARINGWTLSEDEVGFFTAAERTLIEHADAVVPISDSIARTIQHEYRLRADVRWTRSYCGIAYWPSFDPWKNYAELKEINGQPLTFPTDARIVLFVGRLEKRKGIDTLLAAAPAILAHDNNVHLVIAGNDGEGWSTKVASDLPRDRVHFLGAVDDATRDKLLHAAYCLVFPSRYESFGLVPLEAFVHGTPVVAADAGAIPEVVQHECGLLFPPGDGAELGRQVVRLLSSPELRQFMSEGARRQVHRFSSRATAIETVKLYTRLLGGPQPLATHRTPEIEPGVTEPQTDLRPSFGFSGSHPRLQTRCGVRVDKEMRTTGNEGFLIYGPYVDLRPGAYVVRLLGAVRAAGSRASYVEYVCDGGRKLLRTEQLVTDAGVEEIACAMLQFEEPAQLEVRVWVDSDADLMISKLLIVPKQFT